MCFCAVAAVVVRFRALRASAAFCEDARKVLHMNRFDKMNLSDVSQVGAQADLAPRPVSRGAVLQNGFLGLDSLYVVLEYPAADVFQFWRSFIGDLDNARLHGGIVVDDFVVRRGANGYKLSVWDGDARLFLTDRVESLLAGTDAEGQGMGVMLQLGPKWLRENGDILTPI